jgi:5,10-methylenetetrahydromethanopterin reductase
MKQEISIALQSDKSAQTYIELARALNAYDFDAVSVYCDAPFHPSYGPLLLMAPHLRRARLGPAAVSPFRIHPIDIAANTALLAGLARGGVYIGLARGAWLAQHGIREPKSPLQGMREAVQIIRSLLAGETAGLDGKVFQINPQVRAPYPLPEGNIPLMIGTWGRKLTQIAGEIADEVKVGGSANPGMARIVGNWLREGTEKAKRATGSVGIVIGAVTVVDEDREAARELARQEAALYLPVVAKLDPSVEIEEELVQRIEEEVRQGDREKAGGLISDDLLDKFAFSGRPEDLVSQAEALFDVGVQRIEFGTPHGLDPRKGIRLLGEKVLPGLASYR